MTRSELIEQLAQNTCKSITAAEAVVHEIFDSMADTLIAGGRIEIRGFGCLEIREYGGYSGRNPKTGLEVPVGPKKLPFFKVGKELKERIMAGGGH
jgi:integration host factor subunit beta